MQARINKSKYVAISAVLGFGLIFNLLNWHNEVIGITFSLLYLLFLSFIFGSIFISKPGWQIVMGLVFLLSLVAVIGSLALYFLIFDNNFIITLILLLPIILITPYYYARFQEKFSLKQTIKKYLDKFDERREPKRNFFFALLYLATAISVFYLLIKSQTAESIQTPWQTVSGIFFPIYFISTALLLIYLLNSHRTKGPLALIILHTFLSSCVALIVYQIGYGFDPFIHQATEKIIWQTGLIQPTPLYYLGQYAIVVFLSKISTVDLVMIDRLLVPTLFSLTLGPTIFYVFNFWLKKNYALVLALAGLIMPFTSFIMTAPQNLANLFFIITILLAMLYYRNQIHISILYLLASATLVIHPLAGIPLIITVILLNLFKLLYTSYIKYLSLYFLAALVFIIFLPLAFLSNGSSINFDPDLKLADLQWLGWVDKFDLPLNLVYLIDLNQIIIAGLIIILGLNYIARHKLLKNNAPFLTSAAVIFLSYLIVRYFITFPNLRDNDRADFISRLLSLSFYILLPFFLLGLYIVIKKLWEKDFFTRLFLIFILTAAITASLYLSYPRLDNYQPAKFFSVSASDLKAVNFIEQVASPQHIVLANQMVGVSAIKEFGFKKYYGNQFFYSMPTGLTQTFYDYYLEMIYQGARRETINRAITEAGVIEGYFVLNSYWNNSEKIAASARKNADQVYNIDDGKVIIFKYLK